MSPAGAFAVRRGEVSRLDVSYYLPEFRENEEKLKRLFPGIKTIGDYGDVICGPFGSAVKYDDYREAGVPFIRITNITSDGHLDLSDLVFIEEAQAQELASFQVVPGDVVISRPGTVGLPAVVPPAYPKWCISANLLAIRRPALDPRYIAAFLGARPGFLQLRRAQSGQVQPKITTTDLSGVLIPEVDEVSGLLKMMARAKELRDRKLAEADELLRGVDGLTMKLLHVTLPTPAKGWPTVYAVRGRDLGDVQQLTAEYFHPERLRMIHELRAVFEEDRLRRLGDVADVVRQRAERSEGDYYVSLSNVQPNTGEWVEGQDEDAQGSVFAFQAGDVLFGRLRPYLNKVLRAEWDGVCSPEFHVVRIRAAEAELLPDYLAAVLRSSIVLAQTRHMMTGNTHPRLGIDDMENLLIPIAGRRVEVRIADEVKRRREEARELRAEAAALWERAQGDFEAALIATAKAE